MELLGTSARFNPGYCIQLRGRILRAATELLITTGSETITHSSSSLVEVLSDSAKNMSRMVLG